MPLNLLEMPHFLKVFSIKAGEMRAHAYLIHSQSCSTSGCLIFSCWHEFMFPHGHPLCILLFQCGFKQHSQQGMNAPSPVRLGANKSLPTNFLIREYAAHPSFCRNFWGESARGIQENAVYKPHLDF
jgi:hypothetical protein